MYYPARARSARAQRACALRALGLLLADSALTVGWGKTFWCVGRFFAKIGVTRKRKSKNWSQGAKWTLSPRLQTSVWQNRESYSKKKDFQAENQVFGPKRAILLTNFRCFFMERKTNFWPKKCSKAKCKNGCFSVNQAGTRSVVIMGLFWWPGRSYQISFTMVQNQGYLIV